MHVILACNKYVYMQFTDEQFSFISFYLLIIIFFFIYFSLAEFNDATKDSTINIAFLLQPYMYLLFV